jgi:hypothetical protein
MKIEIRFPHGTRPKQIVEVCSALGELENDGYDFEVVIGEPAPTVVQRQDPVQLPGPVPIPQIFDPDDYDLEQVISMKLPGFDDQEDADARRRVKRED